MSSTKLITKEQIAAFYKDKKILIIGGTGSIGEAMIDQLLKYDPTVIRILSRDEYKQYLLSNKYSQTNPAQLKKLRFLLGDVRDYERIEKAANDIDIIFNLAALKHVPACEYNPFEAVKTNVIGMENVINAAIACKAKNVVFTSSDKAIGPTNAMGATKLLGERLMIAADNMKGSAKVSFSAVRFGNVLGSRGSVIPLFMHQLEKYKKLTITDPQMTRFMMSITDAITLTLTAAAMAKGGEIFVLKMPNIAIKDLVDCVIDLGCKKLGLNKDEIEISEIGLRAGEKLYEELMTEHESEQAYELENMYCILPDFYRYREDYEKNNIQRTEIQKYASDKVDVISKDELRSILISENLI